MILVIIFDYFSITISSLQQDEVILPKGNDSEKKILNSDDHDHSITVDPKDITLKLDSIADKN